MTERLYLEDAYCREFDALVTESADGWSRLSRTVFHPGGGGQPFDRGWLSCSGTSHPVTGMREEGELLWHQVGVHLEAGQSVHGGLDWPRRLALMRHHCLLHVVNALAHQRFGGLVTGAEIAPERSRVDLSVTAFTRDDLPAFEAAVNEVIGRGLRVWASVVPEAMLETRPELVRTLKVRPPVVNGGVRIVELEGFDAQACGGTHVHSTTEIGEARIVKFDNRGKNNKRFYWELAPHGSRPTVGEG
jgi:misacylated tRNA(Ala) deacylase